jgi:hypothetical protein
MFNYCSGDVKENDGVQSDEVTDCTAKKPDYVFDLEDLIQEHSETTVNFPAAANRAQKTVNIVSRFMVTCYTIATLCTGVTFLVGWFGLLSRWGSCITTIFATVNLPSSFLNFLKKNLTKKQLGSVWILLFSIRLLNRSDIHHPHRTQRCPQRLSCRSDNRT